MFLLTVAYFFLSHFKMMRAVDTVHFVTRTYNTLRGVQTKQVAPRTAGTVLAKEVADMGPLYVKMAQFISARRDALPQDMVEALSVVQDAVPSLHPPPVPLLDGYDIRETPLASASIADVFEGRRISDGTRVAVKRLKAGVKSQIATDLPLLMATMNGAAFFNVPGARNMYELIRESQSMLMDELDFRKEAAAMLRFQHAYTDVPWLVIPRVIRASEDTLVSEYISSFKLSQVALPCPELAQRLMDMYMLMIQEGQVHADPHPGNVGFLEGGSIVLYDFGAVVEVEVDVARAVTRMLQAGITKNAEGLLGALEDIGVVRVQPGQRTSVRRLLRKVLGGNVHKELQNAPEFTDSERRIVKFGTTFIYLVRTFSLIEASCKALDPGFEYDYAQWVQTGPSDAMTDLLRDVTSMPSTVTTMQGDMEEFQISILSEIGAIKRVTGVASFAAFIFWMLSIC